MSKPLTYEQFVAGWGSSNVDELRAAGTKMGHAFKAKTLPRMIDEAWDYYQADQKGGPPPADASPPPAAPPVRDDGPLTYEGRTNAVTARRFRAGYFFTPVWTTLDPSPTEEQLERLKADPHIQFRIKE